MMGQKLRSFSSGVFQMIVLLPTPLGLIDPALLEAAQNLGHSNRRW